MHSRNASENKGNPGKRRETISDRINIILHKQIRIKDFFWVLINATLILFFGFACFQLGQVKAENNEIWFDKTDQLPDRIPQDDVRAFATKLEVKGNYELAYYSNTNSMIPLLDQGSTGIYLPYKEQDIIIGDVISFDYNGGRASHRVINMGIDDEGTYYQTKGDNLEQPDNIKIRKKHIKGILVGVLW